MLYSRNWEEILTMKIMFWEMMNLKSMPCEEQPKEPDTGTQRKVGGGGNMKTCRKSPNI